LTTQGASHAEFAGVGASLDDAERMTLAEVHETFLPALRKASASLVTRLHVA
jgi:hypothetical protein